MKQKSRHLQPSTAYKQANPYLDLEEFTKANMPKMIYRDEYVKSSKKTVKKPLRYSRAKAVFDLGQYPIRETTGSLRSRYGPITIKLKETHEKRKYPTYLALSIIWISLLVCILLVAGIRGCLVPIAGILK